MTKCDKVRKTLDLSPEPCSNTSMKNKANPHLRRFLTVLFVTGSIGVLGAGVAALNRQHEAAVYQAAQVEQARLAKVAEAEAAKAQAEAAAEAAKAPAQTDSLGDWAVRAHDAAQAQQDRCWDQLETRGYGDPGCY